MAFEDFAQQYVTLVQDGCMVDAKELVEGYQAAKGWGPGEEAAIEMMLDGEAVYPPGEPEFMDSLFRYKLTAKNRELDIGYSSDNRWLALESTVKGGRKLRYELT